MQVFILREEVEDNLVGHADIFRVAAERHPAEGAAALAEEGTDEGWHEAGVGEGVLHAGVEGPLAQVVAVVEDHCAARCMASMASTWRAMLALAAAR